MIAEIVALLYFISFVFIFLGFFVAKTRITFIIYIFFALLFSSFVTWDFYVNGLQQESGAITTTTTIYEYSVSDKLTNTTTLTNSTKVFSHEGTVAKVSYGTTALLFNFLLMILIFINIFSEDEDGTGFFGI